MNHENAPKPKPPVKRAVPNTTKHEPIKEEKKPFVRKPHLTQRPFSDNALLTKIREQAQPNAPKSPRRKPSKETGK